MNSLLQQIKSEKVTSFLSDPASKAILNRLIKQGKYGISDLDAETFPSTQLLARLYKFEQLGMLKSKFEQNGSYYERVFTPGDIMEDVKNALSEFP
jgi:hypothetical protein